MIFDQIQRIERYRFLGEGFSKAIDFILQADVSSLPLGQYEIDGQSVYGFSKETLLEHENLRWEAHKVYADIQLVLDGAEKLAFLPFRNQPVAQSYDQAKDILFYSEADAGNLCTLYAGDFMIFMPGELHRPDCPAEGFPTSRKLVVKVRVE